VGRCRNPQQRVERLFSAWNKGSKGLPDKAGDADDPLIGAATEPVRRGGTRLSNTQRDVIRTLNAEGVPINDIAERFGVHRSTIYRQING